MDLSAFNADYPYPDVKPEAKNAAYAREMLANCSDSTSEMTSYALYMYDWIITQENGTLSQAFGQVKDVERKHLEIFGNLAFQLGADPRLWAAVATPQTRRMCYWNPARINYAYNQKILLQNALALERATVTKYERQTREIRDDAILLVLRRILLDEQLHVELFRSLLAEL
jgi:bacterioferritin